MWKLVPRLLIGPLWAALGLSGPLEAPDPPAQTLSEVTMASRLWTARNDGYRPPDPVRRRAIRRLFGTLAGSAHADLDWVRLRELANTAGFEVQHWELGTREYLAILEEPAHRTGSGAYVVRLGPRTYRRELVVQAPHSFHDRTTGSIALFVFLEAGDAARALFVNTAHRQATRSGDRTKREDSPADPCHNSAHPFNVATRAFAAGAGRIDVVQLHGFAQRPGNRASVIVSAGNAAGSTRRTRQVAARLAARLTVPVARFPEDTSILGATTNVQGAALRRVAGASFVHIELSSRVRAALQSRETAHEFAEAVTGDR